MCDIVDDGFVKGEVDSSFVHVGELFDEHVDGGGFAGACSGLDNNVFVVCECVDDVLLLLCWCWHPRVSPIYLVNMCTFF